MLRYMVMNVQQHTHETDTLLIWPLVLTVVLELAGFTVQVYTD